MPRTKKRSAEQKRKEHTEIQRKRRQDPKNLQQERLQKKQHREATEQGEEQSYNTERRRSRRLAEKFRRQELERQKIDQQRKRRDPEFREKEKEKDAAHHSQLRLDPEYSAEEHERQKMGKRRKRTDPDFRAKEKENVASHQSQLRLDPEFSATEQEKNTAQHKKKREDPEVRQAYNEKQRALMRQRSSVSYDRLLARFQSDIRKTPVHICSCCGGLFYKDGVVGVTESDLKKRKCDPTVIRSVLHVEQDNHLLCKTCHKSAVTNNIPRLALVNGFELPTIPEQLQGLTRLEERLVAPRIPFMVIKMVGSERQSVLCRDVVNIENDLDVCATVLPREFDEAGVVQCMLKRYKNQKIPYMHERIRPKKVWEAMQYLVGTELYRDHKIELSKVWQRHLNEETMQFVVPEEVEEDSNEEGRADVDARLDEETSQLQEEMEPNEGIVEDELEGIHQENIGAEESLIFRGETATAYGISIAPGEGKRPTPIHLDPDADILSFPTIYCSQRRKFNKKFRIGQADIVKSETRHYDRRCCRPDKILHTFKRTYNERVWKQLFTTHRKQKGKSKVKARDLLSPEFMVKLLEQDEGYAVFKKVKCTPAYWQAVMKKVVSMVRQLGKCAFFVTFSAAETKWGELLVALKKIVKGEEVTEEEAVLLGFEEKAEMIGLDPVTCMTHFNHRFASLLKFLIKPENGVFNPHEVLDWFCRLEFQLRGSPHVHCLFWLKDAPTFRRGCPESEIECCKFVDSYITCERSEEPEMDQVIGYQIHNHSHTCFKRAKGNRKCRFGFPKPPMKTTRILQPLPNTEKKKEIAMAKENFQKLQNRLTEMGKNFKDDIPFEDFLSSLELTEEDYIRAIRSSLKRADVFLKRSTNAIFVNPYNRKLLLAWGANIDVQYVLDTYACAKYCVGYIAKSDTGLSKAMRVAAEQIKKGNASIREKLQKFARVLIHGTEISAQEAAAFLLQLSSTTCSRTDIFVNTSRPEDRTYIFKRNEDVRVLDEDSEDVYCKGTLHHYAHRPKTLENVCLAEFATMYDYKTDEVESEKQDEEDDPLEMEEEVAFNFSDDLEDDEENSFQYADDDHPAREIEMASQSTSTESSPFTTKKKEWINLRAAKGSIGRRRDRSRKILRFRHFDRIKDPEDYWRVQLMLFTPWRNEETELLKINAEAKANRLKDLIERNSAPYFHDQDYDDNDLNEFVNEIQVEEDATFNLERDVQDDVEIEDEEENLGQMFPNVFERQPLPGTAQKFLKPRMVDNDEFFQTMRELNDAQRRIVLETLHRVKISRDPFYYLLHGGAGVGKSFVLKAIIQCILRHYEDYPICSPEEICVLVCAPTGKAAFNVFGMTIHSVFKLPPNQSKNPLRALDDGSVNTIRQKLRNCVVFFADECSMVSSDLIMDINERLQQIYHNRLDFGGKSFLLCGHFRQLRPVSGSYIFENPNRPRGNVAGNYLWDRFRMFELTEIVRQKGDYQFCKALNNLAEGTEDDEDIALLKSREIEDSSIAPPEAVWLFWTNYECEQHNKEVHQKLTGDGVISEAFDYPRGSGPDWERRAVLKSAKKLKPDKTDGLPYELSLKVGAQYFVTTNIDVCDGLFNGADGVLQHIDYGTVKIADRNIRVPKRAWIKFKNSLVGLSEKSKVISKIGRRRDVQKEWIPIERIKRQLSKGRDYMGWTVIRDQFPLFAANARTVYKSQGDTFYEGVVVVLKRGWSRSAIYVSFSRPPSSSKLYILGPFDPSRIGPPSKKVTEELERLRRIPFDFSLKFLQDYDASMEKLYFHNVEHFLPHRKDIEADQCAMSSSLLLLVEPWLLPEDEADLNGYYCAHRTNCRNTRNSEGALLFVKQSDPRIDSADVLYFPDYKDNSHCFFMTFFASSVQITCAYKHPNYSKTEFLHRLETKLESIDDKSIVLGDLNMNLQDPENGGLIELLTRFGYESKLDVNQPSTNGGTHVDCFFANFPVQAWFYETYYSYHKPICAVWEK